MKLKKLTAAICALCTLLAISACAKDDEVAEEPTEPNDNIIQDVETETESNDADVTEIAVIIGEGTDYPLDGILSMPLSVRSEQVPAVVLIHGSGPYSMDEEINGITVFRDIADYLTSNNVAVLRYNKRTYSYPAKLSEEFGADLTVEQEVIEDALLARELLLQDERIDPERIYIVGHSLGGMLAPRIVDEGDFAGAVIMAGSPRSLLDISYDQTMYFIELMDISEEERAALYAQVDPAREMYFGMPEVYITEMDSHPPEDYLLSTDKPFLILQGDKDFQITTEADFNLYKDVTAGRDNFEFILYDDLNHLFIVSTMENPTTDDYVAGSKVDEAVLSDIVGWVTSH